MGQKCNLKVPISWYRKYLDDADLLKYYKIIGRHYTRFNKSIKICGYPNCFYYIEAENLVS